MNISSEIKYKLESKQNLINESESLTDHTPLNLNNSLETKEISDSNQSSPTVSNANKSNENNFPLQNQPKVDGSFFLANKIEVPQDTKPTLNDSIKGADTFKTRYSSILNSSK